MKIKDSAARSNFASQCVELPKLKDWATNNIFLGINAKLGGQAELCDDLAEPGTVFVSYDVSRQRSIGLSGDAMLLGNDGRMISGQADSCYQKGEILDAQAHMISSPRSGACVDTPKSSERLESSVEGA